MRSKGNWLLAFAAVAGMLALAGVSFSATDEEKAQKPSKKVDITIRQPVKVGDLNLEPGRYMIQHFYEEGGHYMHFTELAPESPHATGNVGSRKYVGKAKCTLEPLATKATQTAVYFNEKGGVQRLEKIEVAGESEAHVF